MVDKNYCMSSYLALRHVYDKEKTFKENMKHFDFEPIPEEKQIACASEEEIEEQILRILGTKDLTKAALLLSGGMDSAILASYMPKGTKAYTARCMAPGAVDETQRAKQYCEFYGLEHIVVDITWQDYLDSIDFLMLNDGCPVNSNEPQVYKLAQAAKFGGGGVEIIVFGDNADVAFGGMNELMAKDWTFDEWVERYTYLWPEKVIKNPVSMNEVFEPYRTGEQGVDFERFLKEEFSVTSSGAYVNAFRNAQMDYVDPYAFLKMRDPLDLNRVRNGDSKYLIRRLFQKRYPGFEVPEKIAMPRAVDQWLADWEGPSRKEFLPNCIEGMTGKQKFQVFALERFLNLIEPEGN